MDQQSINMLTVTAVDLLVKYLVKAGDRVAKEAGGAIFQAIQDRFQKKEGAKETFEDLRQSPQDPDLQAAVRVQVRKLLQEDETFLAQLQQLLPEAEEKPGSTVINIKQEAGNDAFQIGQSTGNVEYNRK